MKNVCRLFTYDHFLSSLKTKTFLMGFACSSWLSFSQKIVKPVISCFLCTWGISLAATAVSSCTCFNWGKNSLLLKLSLPRRRKQQTLQSVPICYFLNSMTQDANILQGKGALWENFLWIIRQKSFQNIVYDHRKNRMVTK